MKLKKILLSVFSVVPLIVNFVFMFILPEQIPMHYGTDFKADRYGSKIEVWFLAAVILIMGIVFLIIARFMKEEVNKMLSLNCGLIMVVIFNILDYCLLYIWLSDINDLSVGFFRLDRITLLLVGIIAVTMGNLMPMSRRNSFIGVRTKWSQKNDYVWKKCQMFGGISTIVLGVICFILAFVYPNAMLMWFFFVIKAFTDVVYSYIAAKKDNHKWDKK